MLPRITQKARPRPADAVEPAPPGHWRRPPWGEGAQRLRGDSFQPAALAEVPHGPHRARHHQRDAVGVAIAPLQFRHELEVHPVHARDERGRQQRDARHREDLDDLVLVDVDEADRGVHQEVDLVEQERRVVVQRLDVAQDLPRILELLGVQHLAAHHEAHGAARVHHVAADAAVQVLLARDGCQHLAGARIRHVARQHLGAHFLELVVDALERVGGVFRVQVEQLEQHLLGILDQARRPARAHAQQPEDGQVLVVDGEQYALALERVVDQVEDEGHAHRTGVVLVVDQEIAADMQLAVVFLVEAGGFLDVLVHRVRGDLQAVVLLDPALFLERGRFQVHPDRLEACEFFQGFDLFLDEAAVGEREDVEHGLVPGGLALWRRWRRGAGEVLSTPRRPWACRELKATDWGRFPRSFLQKSKLRIIALRKSGRVTAA